MAVPLQRIPYSCSLKPPLINPSADAKKDDIYPVAGALCRLRTVIVGRGSRKRGERDAAAIAWLKRRKRTFE